MTDLAGTCWQQDRADLEYLSSVTVSDKHKTKGEKIDVCQFDAKQLCALPAAAPPLSLQPWSGLGKCMSDACLMLRHGITGYLSCDHLQSVGH